MAGHSHWAGIKHKKAAVDKKRGKLFSKIARQIMNAARTGGGDPSTNLSLAYAIERAKDANMPKENIERAIKKGTGDLPGESLEEVTYEGYAPGGVAVMVQVLTDNKNRSVAEIRKIFERRGGNMGAQGCVAWMFQPKGMIIVSAEGADEDELLLAAADAGADDVNKVGDTFQVVTPPDVLQQVRKAVEESGFKVESAELTYEPSSTVPLDDDTARKVLALMEELEDHDDVQNVYANLEISEELMAEIASQE